MAGVGVQLTLCQWMVLVAAGLTPLTWMGTPKVSKHIYLSIGRYLNIYLSIQGLLAYRGGRPDHDVRGVYPHHHQLHPHRQPARGEGLPAPHHGGLLQR